jgi:uncharacterized protein
MAEHEGGELARYRLMVGTTVLRSCAVGILVTITLVTGCQGRGSEPGPSAGGPSAGTRPPPPDLARCIVESPKTPPPTAAPAGFCPPAPLPDIAFGKGKVAFSTPGVSPIQVEVARTPEQRNRGLMARDSMPANQGMIFAWPENGRRQFWMRNTCLPLDMLFIAMDGTIVSILEQVPTMNDDARLGPCPAAFVLEVNAGWSREHHVKPGDRVEITL